MMQHKKIKSHGLIRFNHGITDEANSEQTRSNFCEAKETKLKGQPEGMRAENLKTKSICNKTFSSTN